MKKIIVVLVWACATLGVGILFLLVGATIGGNFFVDFEFMGNRGYEATGVIGFYIGLVIGGLAAGYGAISYLKKLKERENKKITE